MSMKTRNSNPRSRFDEIQKMQEAGLDRNQMAERMGISRAYLSRHIREMNGLGIMNKRPELPFLEKIKETKDCTFCGFRFNPLLRDANSTKCESCYQFLLQKMECKTCHRIFVDQSRGLKDKRSECWQCRPSNNDLSDKLPRMWRDERWFSVFRQHDSGCLVCGSDYAKTRDGRFCSWRHDPDFLDDQEAEELMALHWRDYE